MKILKGQSKSDENGYEIYFENNKLHRDKRGYKSSSTFEYEINSVQLINQDDAFVETVGGNYYLFNVSSTFGTCIVSVDRLSLGVF